MKKLALAVAVAGLLSACGTTGSNHAQQYKEQYERQEKQAKSAIAEAPEWMSKLPKSVNAVYENGTATSIDMSMADLKAKTIAYAKICTAAGGKVRSQMKMYRNDNGDASIEQSELTVRSLCPDVDITGVETVEMKHVADGNRIRTYVLVALPIGQANIMKSTKDAERRAPEAFRELDEVTTGRPVSDATPTQGRGITLMPVDNEEYKRKRDEALQKPGAVIGQVTVQ
jgi:hypothetical protein